MVTDTLFRIAGELDEIADSEYVEAGVHMRLHDKAKILRQLAKLIVLSEEERASKSLWKTICRILKTRLW